MAIAQQYSYHYRIAWGEQPRVILAGEFGVGLNPNLKITPGLLTLTHRDGRPPGPSFESLSLRLPPGLEEGDVLQMVCTPLNGHRSFSWWRWGQLQMHLGDLQSLSGERVGQALLEIVNEYDHDGRLAFYQRNWTLRLAPGESGQLGDYHFRLNSLTGLVTGSSYRSEGWLGLGKFSAEQLQEWCNPLPVS